MDQASAKAVTHPRPLHPSTAKLMGDYKGTNPFLLAYVGAVAASLK